MTGPAECRAGSFITTRGQCGWAGGRRPMHSGVTGIGKLSAFPRQGETLRYTCQVSWEDA